MASITKEKKLEIVDSFGAAAADTGNVRVQVAIISERIRNLTEHLKVHKKDKHTLKGLTSLVSQRRRLLKYYAKKDIEGYRELIKELGLRR